jgi:hypothetical protein
LNKTSLQKRHGKRYGYEVLFKGQARHPSGKTGVIIAENGMPEDYEPEFYNDFMVNVFDNTLPAFLAKMILVDKGTGLIDPDNPMAREEFKPRQLVDSDGSFTNKAGIPYAQCKVKWRPANKKNPWDHGYFLYTGDGPNGRPDVCDKVGAKVVGWYYGRLIPEKKVSWRSQLRKVYEEAVQELGERFPGVEFRNAYYLDRESLGGAVEELLANGCKTIVYQSINCPLYSDFEDYNHSLPLIHEFVNGRASVIMADQLGNQAPMREAYVQILRDQLQGLPPTARVLVILSQHGHPFKKETLDRRAKLYQEPLEAGIRALMSTWEGEWNLVWSFDEFADKYWDKKGTKFETYAAYRQAIEASFAFAIELPTEFPAENTDLMIFHAMKKFRAFPDYDRNQMVPYPDWEKPLVRKFHAGSTIGIYAGTPVGSYRKYVVQAVINSISEVLDSTRFH